MPRIYLNGWAKGFGRWVAYVAPVVAVMIWLDFRYISREEVRTLKIAADEVHRVTDVKVDLLKLEMVREISTLRITIDTLNREMAELNGYLAGREDVALRRRRTGDGTSH